MHPTNSNTQAPLSPTRSHTISGHNFHGRYTVTFRGPREGWTLDEAQVRRYRHALCGVAGCICGGGYGNGPDRGGAYISIDGGEYRLVPAQSEQVTP